MKEKNVGSDGGDKCNGMKLGVGVKDAGSEWKKRVVGQCSKNFLEIEYSIIVMP